MAVLPTMPYLSNLNDYLRESALLLRAYPENARITTKYSVRADKSRRKSKLSREDGHRPKSTVEAIGSGQKQQLSSSTLIFKTFEPTAGICLKYKTNKAAEVGRLMIGVGRLAHESISTEPSKFSLVPAYDQAQRQAETGLGRIVNPAANMPEKISEATSTVDRMKKKEKGRR